MTSKIKDQIEQHKLDSRLSLYDRVKWITPKELIKRYGEDIHPLQLELILQNDELTYPVNE